MKKAIEPYFIALACCFLISMGNSPVLLAQGTGRLAIDSTEVEYQHVDTVKLEQYRSDPDFQYSEVPSSGTSLWNRIVLLLGIWLSQLFSSSDGESSWAKYLIYIISTGIIIYVLLKLLKVDIRHVFYRPSRQAPLQHRKIEEDIHEMDLDTLIKNALNQSKYREAIRLVYLAALKELSERDHLQWKVGKTNHEYMNELIGTPFQKEFDELSYYFDYSWYGQFAVDRQAYESVSKTYNNLIKKSGQ